MLQFVDAIRRDSVKEPGANEQVDCGMRCVGNDTNVQTVVDALIMLGQILRSHVLRESLEQAVTSQIDA